MCFHNDPEYDDREDEDLRKLTLVQFEAIKASILAGDEKELHRVYDRFDDWLVGSSRAQESAVIRDALAGGKAFEKLMNQLVWDEALARAEIEQLADREDRRESAEDDRIQRWLDARAA